ncbi:MAG: type II secretion system protein N [Pseudomonadota bacterium]
MKTKYLGVTAVIIAVVSILIAGLIFALVSYDPLATRDGSSDRDRTLSPQETRRLQQIQYYAGVMEEVFADRPAAEATVARLFPDRVPDVTPIVQRTALELTMVYRTGEGAVALINEALYRVGDTLPGGARLVSIDSDSVWIQQGGERRRLPLDRSGPDATGSIVLNANVSQ